jgi:signal peptidase I
MEFKENNTGEWKRFSVRLLSDDDRKKALTGAGLMLNAQAEGAFELDQMMPVVFENITGSHKHYILESSWSTPLSNRTCPDISGHGCLIPEEHYFMMGDHRDNSQDSRFFGFVRRENIYGMPHIVYFSIDWRDDICREFQRNSEKGTLSSDSIFNREPFESVIKHCSSEDIALSEEITGYISHAILRRIPRMRIRWSRISTKLE